MKLTLGIGGPYVSLSIAGGGDDPLPAGYGYLTAKNTSGERMRVTVKTSEGDLPLIVRKA